MTEPAIRVEDLVVSFRPYVDHRPTLQRSLSRLRHRSQREVVALNSVSFEVARGEAMGVIGRNGAGKSTLLRCLAGTLRPTSGKVIVNGKTSTLLQLGVGFNPELSGTNNVYLGGLAGGMRRDEIDEKFDDIVEYADLGDAIDRPLKTYSSGMFSRLAFSVGIHVNPEILLLDEVLAVGDQGFRQQSLESLKALLERSGTIVFVSHSLGSVSKLCDRALWIDRGELQMVGPATETIAAYKDATRSRRDVAAAGNGADEDGGGRVVSAEVRVDAVMRVLKGESVEGVASDLDLEPERISRWERQFVRSGARGMRKKVKEEKIQ